MTEDIPEKAYETGHHIISIKLETAEEIFRFPGNTWNEKVRSAIGLDRGPQFPWEKTNDAYS